MLAIANRELLARHWRAFLAVLGRSIGIVLLGMILLLIVTDVVGAALRPFVSNIPETSAAPVASLGFGVLLFASFGPIATALIEDFTFRHTLLMKFPVWGNLAAATLLTLVNAILFGAIHINNFGGQWILTLSFAAAGLLMNLIYLWTRNIWHVLLLHAANNFIIGGPLTLLFVYATGGTIG
ncbi:CPBP family intramembrane glutamic endopeptidase [Luethyella okanaganae]|uniref:CPBP family intramembrane glutamic endopeptidase n=1 Tax=Luethyella okanaganae TaxID=69372 RepID=A0ABW1VH37_9MICO